MGITEQTIKLELGHRFRLIAAFDDRQIEGKFCCGLARCTGPSWGYVDTNGECRIQRQYKDCADFIDGVACVKDSKGWFLIDTDGERVTDEYFDECCTLSEGTVRYRRGGKFGFMTVKGRTITEPVFIRAADFSSGMAAVEVEGKTGFIDGRGTLAVPPQYDPLPHFRDRLLSNQPFRDYSFNEGSAAVSLNGLYGYIRPDGEWMISPRYECASFFHDGIATVRTKKGMCAIDANGKELFEPKKIWLGLFGHGLAGFTGTAYVEYNGVIRADGSILYADKGRGNTDTDRRLRYKFLDCSAGMIPFQRHGRWGYLDECGRETIPAVYDQTYAVGSRGHVGVRQGDKYGLVAKTGKVLIDCVLDDLVFYDGGDRLVVNSGDVSLLYEVRAPGAGASLGSDEKGAGIARSRIEKAVAGVLEIKAEYDLYSDADMFLWKNETSEGLTAYCQNRQYGFYNEEGAPVISPLYSRVRGFKSGICCVSDMPQGRQWSFIDRGGNSLFSLASRDGADAYDGRIMERCHDKTGYLDTCGNTSVPFVYDLGNHFSEGLASVETGGLWGFIDLDGRMVIEPAFESVSYASGAKYRFSEGLAAVMIDGLFGYVDRNGSLVIAPMFEWAHDFHGGYAEVKTIEGYSVIDRDGNRIVPVFQRPVRKVCDSFFIVGGPSYVDEEGPAASLVDREGSIIAPLSNGIYYDNVDYSAGVIPVWDSRGHGLIDFNGKTVVPAKHEFIYYDRFGYNAKTGEYLIIFRDKGKKGIMNQHGDVLVEPVFEGQCWFGSAGLLTAFDVENRKVQLWHPCLA